LILAVLERGEAHGFEVLRRLQEAGCGALRLREGSLYPALYRLEEAGLLQAEWEDGSGPRRGPRRRIYSLTPKGTQQLAQGRDEWRQFVSVLGGILGASG
jgi:DNA-binding PadR family transcriptional regulator